MRRTMMSAKMRMKPPRRAAAVLSMALSRSVASMAMYRQVGPHAAVKLKRIVLRSILAAKLRVRVVASYIAHGMAVAAMWPLPTTTKAIAPVGLTTRTSR
jgi:hypothetical protein